MKRILFLLALLCVCLCDAAVWERELLISTRNTSLMLTAGEGESLKFAYYGDRIDDMERNRIHDAWIGLNKDAYPVFGTTCNFAHAMQVTHADGNMTLDLVVSNVARETTERGEHIAIIMKDRLYPFEVTAHYNTRKNRSCCIVSTQVICLYAVAMYGYRIYMEHGLPRLFLHQSLSKTDFWRYATPMEHAMLTMLIPS